MPRKPVRTNSPPGAELFGTESATTLLQLLYILRSSYAKQLADLTGMSVTNVRNQLLNWEASGVIAIQTIGRQRMATLNPRFFAKKELELLLEKFVNQNPDILNLAAQIRSRPRKTGKQV